MKGSMKNTASKDNNQFKVDYDFQGLCCLCHTEVAEFNGSHPNGCPRISKWKGNMAEMRVELNDGSKMTVILCNKCHDGFQPEDMKPLMESVIVGWQVEVNKLDWKDEKKIDHMTSYSKLQVVDRYDFPMSDEDKKNIKNPDIKSLNLTVRKSNADHK